VARSRPLVGQKIVSKAYSQPPSQEIEGESHAETQFTAVTPRTIALRSIITFPEIKVVPRKRKLPISFNITTGDRKRLCVDLSIYIENLHNPVEDLVHDDDDILDQGQETTASAIPKDGIFVDVNDVPLKTGPSWQDLRRLPCGRVCFDPAFYGC
jgi:hypothetical protein